MARQKILEMRDLNVSFKTSQGSIEAIRGVNLDLYKGETLAIVGESGSGKSVTVKTIMGILANNQRINSGVIEYKYEQNRQMTSVDLLKISKKEMRRTFNGKRIAMVFQDPMTSLNPTMTIGAQIMEGMFIHYKTPKHEARQKALSLLELVGITSGEERLGQYPHQLSGGMRQRVVIAIALACDPEILICDEPTTALDVTIQAQILELIKELQEKLGMSVLLITHDFGVVSETCDFVAVMYCGEIVEYTDARTIFKQPKHPYTVGLLNSIPPSDQDIEGDLPVIKGAVPSPDELPKGCRFAPRCPFVSDVCLENIPDLVKDEHGNEIRCWVYTDEWDGDPEAEVKIHAERTS